MFKDLSKYFKGIALIIGLLVLFSFLMPLIVMKYPKAAIGFAVISIALLLALVYLFYEIGQFFEDFKLNVNSINNDDVSTVSEVPDILNKENEILEEKIKHFRVYFGEKEKFRWKDVIDLMSTMTIENETGWRIPTKDEFLFISMNKDSIAGYNYSTFWTSTELKNDEKNYAWTFNSKTEEFHYTTKKASFNVVFIKEDTKI